MWTGGGANSYNTATVQNSLFLLIPSKASSHSLYCRATCHYELVWCILYTSKMQSKHKKIWMRLFRKSLSRQISSEHVPKRPTRPDTQITSKRSMKLEHVFTLQLWEPVSAVVAREPRKARVRLSQRKKRQRSVVSSFCRLVYCGKNVQTCCMSPVKTHAASKPTRSSRFACVQWGRYMVGLLMQYL